MSKQFVTTGSQGQQEERSVTLNMEEFAEKVATAVHTEITKAIEPLTTRIAELEKKAAKESGKRVDNKLHEFKLPKADGSDDRPKSVADQRGYKLPKAED
ncbi:hypothetical protein [Mesorhizobium denitrificans]|uniref:Uncharacterized protein n=1 Tax=Mesorhizobium denitrificans TaxID=2294114 RepID=A0A371XEY7_9HYPH|nr:hypothetical protein [Mesorhizobium denitrificans]RFC67795.1 hypothetical protein DY251_09385 [Mesorhizobium denitrificans]